MFEIILVVLVLAVITAVSLPNFSQSFRSLQLKKSAEDLSFMMRYAQSRAVVKNTTLRLEFAQDASKYWLTQKSETDNASDTDHYERVSNRMGRDCEVPSAVRLETPKSYVQFYSDGQIDPVVIYLCLSQSTAQNESCFTVTSQIKRSSVDFIESRWSAPTQ